MRAFVEKARTLGASFGRNDRRLNTAERAMVEAFENLVTRLTRPVTGPAIAQAFDGGTAALFDSLRALDLGSIETGFAEALDSGLIDGGKLGALDVPTGTVGYKFDAFDPRALAWTRQRAAELVVEISNEQRQTIRDGLAFARERGLTRPETSRLIRGTGGLHQRWQNATWRTYGDEYERMIRTGATERIAIQRAELAQARHKERLLTARSRNIARTEIQTAANQGRYISWAQSIEQGFTPIDSQKRWQTGPKVSAPGKPQVCDLCAPLQGEVVAWDQPFSNGTLMPPAHPSCRCTAVRLPPADKPDVPGWVG